MDKLQKIAMAYQNIMQIQYYFEIAKEQVYYQFTIFFEKDDFFIWLNDSPKIVYRST